MVRVPYNPTSGVKTPEFAGCFGTAEQAAEKVAKLVIPGETRNLASVKTKQKRDSSHKKRDGKPYLTPQTPFGMTD